jgi:hypothetical protein
MTKKILFCVVFFIISLIICVIYKAPSDKVISNLKLSNYIVLYKSNNSLWDGFLSAAEINGIRINNISWSMEGMLFLNGISLKIDDENLTKAKMIIKLTDFNEEIEVFKLSGHSRLKNILKTLKYINDDINLSGEIDYKFDKLKYHLNKNIVDAKALILINNISLENPFDSTSVLEFGDVDIAVDTKGFSKALSLNITVQGNECESDDMVIVINLDDKTYSIKGNLRVTPQTNEYVTNMLKKIASRVSSDATTFEIDYEGSF